MENLWTIISRGGYDILAWDEHAIEVSSKRCALDTTMLLFGLMSAGFFQSEEVKAALKYERKNAYVVKSHCSSYGSHNHSLYTKEVINILGKERVRLRKRANLHVSCVDKINNGIHMSLIDFVAITIQCLGWGRFYANKEVFTPEKAYDVAKDYIVKPIKERIDTCYYLSEEEKESMFTEYARKAIHEGWLFGVRVAKMRFYEEDDFLTGSAMDLLSETHADASLPHVEEWRKPKRKPRNEEVEETPYEEAPES